VAIVVRRASNKIMKNLSSIVWSVLWAITVAITVTIINLLHGEQEYSAVEKMSIGSILWAESLLFGYILYANGFSRSSSNSAIPFQAASGIPIVFYCLVAFLLGLLGFTGIFSSTGFVVVNLLLLLAWLIVQGSMVCASEVIDRNDNALTDARAFYKNLQMNFSRICMQVKMNFDDELFKRFQHVNDENLRYGNPDSKPPVQQLENDLNALTDQMLELSQNCRSESEALKAALNNFVQLLQLRSEHLKKC
jgi:hypothetical protein